MQETDHRRLRRRDLFVLAGGLAGSRPDRLFAQSTAPGGATVTRLDFENTAPGALPAGITMALTGGGGPVKWSVVEDATAPAGSKVLAQSSADRTDNRFPLAILDAPVAADLDARVRFKPVAGEVDRAAGIAFRLSDADNYYVVRANALEDNVRLYRVVGGRRSQFAGADTRVPSGVWQQLGVEARGNRFEVFLDGRSLFTATDAAFTTAGRVALWTKADSITYFDDMVVRALA